MVRFNLGDPAGLLALGVERVSLSDPFQHLTQRPSVCVRRLDPCPDRNDVLVGRWGRRGFLRVQMMRYLGMRPSCLWLAPEVVWVQQPCPSTSPAGCIHSGQAAEEPSCAGTVNSKQSKEDWQGQFPKSISLSRLVSLPESKADGLFPLADPPVMIYSA